MYTEKKNKKTDTPSHIFSVFILLLRLELHHGMQFFRGVAQKGLEITHKAVHISLARRLVNDVFIVVVAQASTQFLIVHLGLVFAHSPATSYFVRVGQLELPAVSCPADESLARLVCEKFQEKLPQLDGATS